MTPNGTNVAKSLEDRLGMRVWGRMSRQRAGVNTLTSRLTAVETDRESWAKLKSEMLSDGVPALGNSGAAALSTAPTEPGPDKITEEALKLHDHHNCERSNGQPAPEDGNVQVEALGSATQRLPTDRSSAILSQDRSHSRGRTTDRTHTDSTATPSMLRSRHFETRAERQHETYVRTHGTAYVSNGLYTSPFDPRSMKLPLRDLDSWPPRILVDPEISARCPDGRWIKSIYGATVPTAFLFHPSTWDDHRLEMDDYGAHCHLAEVKSRLIRHAEDLDFQVPILYIVTTRTVTATGMRVDTRALQYALRWDLGDDPTSKGVPGLVLTCKDETQLSEEQKADMIEIWLEGSDIQGAEAGLAEKPKKWAHSTTNQAVGGKSDPGIHPSRAVTVSVDELVDPGVSNDKRARSHVLCLQPHSLLDVLPEATTEGRRRRFIDVIVQLADMARRELDMSAADRDLHRVALKHDAERQAAEMGHDRRKQVSQHEDSGLAENAEPMESEEEDD